MRILKLSIAAIAMTMVFAPQTQAREFADIYTECGLGAMIAPENATVAAITNVTWDLGTTAISSNISSADSCSGGKAKVAAFIMKSYDNLEVEIASGEGKYMDTLLSMTEKDAKTLRSEFSEVVASTEYATLNHEQKAEKLYSIVTL